LRALAWRNLRTNIVHEEDDDDVAAALALAFSAFNVALCGSLVVSDVLLA
jgi:hypothetical protein